MAGRPPGLPTMSQKAISPSRLHKYLAIHNPNSASVARTVTYGTEYSHSRTLPS